MTSSTLLQGDSASSQPVSGWARHADLIAVAVVALGLTLRIVRLGEGLWYDEIRTLVEYARRPVGTIMTTYDGQNQHVFYSLLARLSFDLFGESAATLRLPAVLLGGAGLWAVYRLGRGVASAAEGLLAAGLLAVSYHHVWFSQNARGYTGLLLFAVVGTAALWRLLTNERASWSTVAVYGVTMALAAYTHLTAVFVSVAHAGVVTVAWWLARRQGAGPAVRPVAALALSALLGAILYAPLLPQLLAVPFSPAAAAVETEWQRPAWFFSETVQGLARGLPGGWLGLVGGGVVVVVGIVSFARKSWALAALLVLPGVLTLAAAIALGHNLRPRFIFFSAGFGLLVAIRGTFALATAAAPRLGPRLATGFLLAAIAASGLKVSSAWGPKQDYEGAASFVERHADPDDAVVTVDVTAYPYAAYFGRGWSEVESLEALEAIERRHRRTWLLYTFPISLSAAKPAIWSWVRSRYDSAASFPGTVGDGAVVVMVTRRS